MDNPRTLSAALAVAGVPTPPSTAPIPNRDADHGSSKASRVPSHVVQGEIASAASASPSTSRAGPQGATNRHEHHRVHDQQDHTGEGRQHPGSHRLHYGHYGPTDMSHQPQDAQNYQLRGTDEGHATSRSSSDADWQGTSSQNAHDRGKADSKSDPDPTKATAEVSYNKALQGLAKEDTDRVDALIREMKELELDISTMTFNKLIRASIKQGDLERVLHFVRMMDSCGQLRETESFNLVLDALATIGDPGRAEEWMEYMSSRNVKLNVVTYGVYCKALARRGETGLIEQVMRKVEADGDEVNVYFYASLISSCADSSPPNRIRAEQAIRELIGKGLDPRRVKRAMVRAVGQARVNEILALYRHS